MSLLREIDTTGYEVVVISPRNHFVFTPLLAGSAVGTLEHRWYRSRAFTRNTRVLTTHARTHADGRTGPRSVMEPVRGLRRNVAFHLAHCTSIDLERRVLVAEVDARISGGGGAGAESFTLAYDHLVLACGATSNTFGIPGVQEHAFFLKEVQDARSIRRRIIDCTCGPPRACAPRSRSHARHGGGGTGFERAMEPGTSDAEKRQLLSFAVVGGGVTLSSRTAPPRPAPPRPAQRRFLPSDRRRRGWAWRDHSLRGSNSPENVSGRACLFLHAQPVHSRGGARFHGRAVYDFINEDVGRYYPVLKSTARISLFEATDKILGSFDATLSAYAAKRFARQGIVLHAGPRQARAHKRDPVCSHAVLRPVCAAWCCPGVPVQRVDKNMLILKNGEHHPFGLLVWSTGIGPNDLVKSLPVAKDRGKVRGYGGGARGADKDGGGWGKGGGGGAQKRRGGGSVGRG